MTSRLPEPVRKLAHALAELPSIGPRQATRLAIFLAAQDGAVRAEIMRRLGELANIKLCARCYFMHQRDGDLCDICADPARDPALVMIVEKETDLISLENTTKFRGRYFIIGPIPKIGTLADWQRERLAKLKASIAGELKDQAPQPGSGQAREIILGFNPSSIGDFNATLIMKELGGLAKKMTRLGRGLPTGGEIEFADDDTLGASLEGRG